MDEDDYRTLDLGSYKWHSITGRTGIIYAKASNKRKTIYLHRLIMGVTKRSDIIDHIDHNGLHNYRTNLRATNNLGNRRNSRKRLSAKITSSYKGVYWTSDNRRKPWRSGIVLSGKKMYLGRYRTEEEAATAYNNAAIEHFGDMACLNVIGA